MNLKEYILNNQEYFEDFITRSTYHSNGIEGNTLSYAETYAILFNDNEFKITSTPREIHEAINHKYVIEYLLKHLDEDLSERMIKDMAIKINENLSEISEYRNVLVRIKGTEYMPPEPVKIPQLMMDFIYNYNHTVYEDIFQKIAEIHIQYERIHPFEDGNGRTGRLIINYELLKNDIAPVVIPKEQRLEYFKLLEDRNVSGLVKFLKKLSIKEQLRIDVMPTKTL